MRVVILGAKGMLGQALKEEFEKIHEVFAYDKEDLDITNKIKIKLEIEKIRPDAVINATAINAVDQIESDSAVYKLAEEVNGYAVGKLAEVCKSLEIVLVHYSSEYVFRGDNSSGYDEDSFIDPVSKYGETKALGEKLLQSATDKFYLIRLSRLFGPAGASEMAKKSFVDTMLDLVLNKGKRELDLLDEEKSCPTYSQDLARLTRQLLEDKKPFGIYHGANAGVCAWYEFAKEIFAIKKIDVKCNSVPASKFPRPAKRPQYSELINTKLPEQRSWQEALREYLSLV